MKSSLKYSDKRNQAHAVTISWPMLNANFSILNCGLSLFFFLTLLGSITGQEAQRAVSLGDADKQSTPAPEAFWTYQFDENVPGRVIFNDLSLYHPNQWRWHFGDGFGSSTDDPTHFYTENGQFLACLTVTNGTGSDTACDTVRVSAVVSSTQELFTSNSALVYPNPVHDQFQILNLPAEAHFATLTSISGQVMRTISGAMLTEPIDIINLPTGVYVLNISLTKGILTRRIVKQ